MEAVGERRERNHCLHIKDTNFSLLWLSVWRMRIHGNNMEILFVMFTPFWSSWRCKKIRDRQTDDQHNADPCILTFYSGDKQCPTVYYRLKKHKGTQYNIMQHNINNTHFVFTAASFLIFQWTGYNFLKRCMYVWIHFFLCFIWFKGRQQVSSSNTWPDVH